MIPKSGNRFSERSCPIKPISDESDSTQLNQTLVLLHHKSLCEFVSWHWSGTAWASRQGARERHGEISAHGRDRVRDVAFRPQWRSLWVGNLRERQVSGRTRRHEVLRGESSPARRSGSRKLRCRE